MSDGKAEYWTIDKCKKAYTQYLANKSDEIEEQKNSRRYYHGAHWTAEQIKELNKRKQPVVTFNRIARKLNGVVGLIDRLKQDPKAYPRTPKSDQGAELATAIIRYQLDSENWNAKAPETALDAAVEGFAGISIKLEEKEPADDNDFDVPGRVDRDDRPGMMGMMPQQMPQMGMMPGMPGMPGQMPPPGMMPPGIAMPGMMQGMPQGMPGMTPPGMGQPPGMGHNGPPPGPDYDVSFEVVEADSFFYDPRSYKADFSDARYMGEAKWLDLETAQELFPEHAEDLAATVEDSTYLSTNPDRENKFFAFDGGKHLIRMVDIWYLHKGKWCWSMFTGSTILDSGESYLFNEKGKTICRYIMFSCNVDHDGDRYGFVRNMKSAQDEYNARRSRALFTANSRRLIMTQGSVADIERTRAEWARPDGVVVTNARTPDEGIKADDASFDFAGQMKLMENAVQELDNYGPNNSLMGDMGQQSGRAIQLLQQAGMAELGPYILGYKGWKIRVYRALFNAVQRYWNAERWIRVTDNDGVAQFIQINGTGIDPRTGQPVMVNAIGELDVDIIMDEGQDTINAQQDVYETLSQIMPSIAPMLKPAEASAAVSILVDSSSLSASAKKVWRDATQQQPDPMAQQAAQLQLQDAAAKVGETQSKTMLNTAKAQSEGMPQGQAPGKFELPPQIQIAKAAADINETQATATHKQALANKSNTDAAIAPQFAAHDMMMDRRKMAVDAHMQGAELLQGAHDAEQDRRNRMQAHNRSGGNA